MEAEGLFKKVNEPPWTLTHSEGGIFRVQYKLSLVDRICGSKNNFSSLFLKKKSKKTMLWQSTYNGSG